MATHTEARSFAAGLLAAVAGTAAGHLVAAVLDPASSPVLAVGTAVINLTPTPVKVWAVRELGTADKPVLVGSVLAGTLLLAGIAGLLARRRFPLGVALLVLLVGAAAAAALIRPAAGSVDAVPALVTGVVGFAVLDRLVRGGSVPRAGGRGTTLPSRRGFLLGAGAVAALSAAAAVTGELVGRARARISEVVLPRAAHPLAPLPTGLEEEHEDISAFRTARADFYRVDTNLSAPIVDADSWRLVVDGDVRRRLALSFEDLTRMRVVEHDITLTCVSNEVGGKLVGSARWLGVPLEEVLDLAGVGSKADQILSTAVDGFTISTPLEVALDGRNTMLAFGMNGEPLPRDHGFPVRLITPGLYGYVGATKWLTQLTLTTYAERKAYWTRRKWSTRGPIKLSSRVDTPRPLSTIRAGSTVIGGVAWAQPDGVARVDVRLDGGAWQEARLGPSAGPEYWRQWYLPWEATPGSHTVAVRATDQKGEVQSEHRATPFPDGSSGIQQVVVNVT